MNNNFLSYDLSLEMKGIGYDSNVVIGAYRHDEKFEYVINERISSDGYFSCIAPLLQQALEFFEKEYSFFVDVRTDTTPNEILGFDFTIKSWKFPPMYVDVFRNKREGYDVVIKKMIELVKG